MKKKTAWGWLHLAAILAMSLSLITGLRIAILDHESLLFFSHFLLQGEVHGLHFLSACVLSGLLLYYGYLRFHERKPSRQTRKSKKFSRRYHRFITYFLYVIYSLGLLTGWLLFSDLIVTQRETLLLLHYYIAIAFVAYFILHGGAYLIEFGGHTFRWLLQPLLRWAPLQMASMIALFIAIAVIWQMVIKPSSHTLAVKTISVDHYIQIDGKASEAIWAETTATTLTTHGGENFNNGVTPITLRAMQNGEELFMLIEWLDDTQSLEHLPLVKTKNGWQIQQNGFHEFAEKQFYEDKFAIMLSDNCALGAAGTARLGPQPLADKPKHWTGKGYHYTDGEIVDLWHWKAVRTNNMKLMDDNYIGPPDILREGHRRYTAGYATDARESGAYKMNWKWYDKNNVTPKRLPLRVQDLTPYQPGNDELLFNATGYIPWFDSAPYQVANDTFPIGTVLPSILYLSNRFEGDRADIKAVGVWQDGKWSLELFRKLDTASEKDVELRDGICLWVAAFDHAQIDHTRHARPIKLRFVP